VSAFGDGWATARSLARLCNAGRVRAPVGSGLSGIAGGAPRWGPKQPAKQALGLRSTQAHAFVAHLRRPIRILGAHAATLWRWRHTDECALAVKPDAAGPGPRPGTADTVWFCQTDAMRRVVRAATVLVGLGGLSFLSLAGTIAFGSFKYATFDCGSVISPKDPTNRVARTAAIPPRRLAARNHCADMRSSRAARLVVMMGIGVAMIFVFLATPTLARRAERRGARRRRRA